MYRLTSLAPDNQQRSVRYQIVLFLRWLEWCPPEQVDRPATWL
jgi:hypothetical protein